MSIFDSQETYTPIEEQITGNGDSLSNLKLLTMGSGANRFEANIAYGLWLGGDTFDTAKISMGFDGVLTASDVVLTGGSISNISLSSLATGSAPSIQGWTSDLTFSSTSNVIVAWSSGSIKLTDGTTFSITAGNTGTMSAVNYIYLDTDVSETVLQKTTTAATAVGTNKILVAVAENVATGKDATFQAFGGKGGVNTLVTADNIAANTITANEILANTITGTEITGTTLSAISADLGTITAGTVTGATLQTSTSGRRVKITTDQYIRWYNGNDVEASIWNESGKFKIDADSYIELVADGSGDYIGLYAGETVYSEAQNVVFSLNNNFQINEMDSQIFNYNSDDDGDDCTWREDSDTKMGLDKSGNLFIAGDLTSDNYSDFAEMFESLDGKKIQTGTSVVLEGKKIRPALEGEEPIGVISATAGITFGNGLDWKDKYLRTELGELIYEDKEFWSLRKVEKNKRPKKYQEEGIKLTGLSDETKPPKGAKIKIVQRRKLNPDWKEDNDFVRRKDRPEWNVVGLLGQVRILKGQPIAKNWIKLREISNNVNEYLIK